MYASILYKIFNFFIKNKFLKKYTSMHQQSREFSTQKKKKKAKGFISFYKRTFENEKR